MLVGATNRVDIVDPAIHGRRLTPIEIGLPDAAGRLKLLQVLCRDVSLGKTVKLKEIAIAAEGMSGADLKRLRDVAGMKALTRATKNGATAKSVSITMADLTAALETMRSKASLVEV
jgi:ATP-dependent 26S proteasome regulatory subunit